MMIVILLRDAEATIAIYVSFFSPDLLSDLITWLRTIGEDLQSQNFGVHTAYEEGKGERYLASGPVVSTATLC